MGIFLQVGGDYSDSSYNDELNQDDEELRLKLGFIAR